MSRQALPCCATNVDGTPCKQYAMIGGTKCAAHQGRVGRKTKLSPELMTQFLTMLRAGSYISVACRAVGITTTTLANWIEASDELREQVEKARAEGEVRLVTQIAHAAPTNWQAAAWLLERQYPDRWGRTSVRLRDPNDESEQQVERSDPDDPFSEVDQLAELRRRRGA